MNLIKNCLIEKEKNSKMNNRTEPFIKKNDSFIDNSSQFENFISEIKPSYEDIKETDILNNTQ
jgi:dephospho-CoA kinase